MNDIRRQEQEREARMARTDSEVNAAVAGLTDITMKIMEQRRAQEARNEAIARARADRLTAYKARVQLAFVNEGPRPLCKVGDSAEAVRLDKPLYDGMEGTECRLADSTSAHFYRLALTATDRVELTIASNDFYPTLVIANDKGRIVAQDPSRVNVLLKAGTYLIGVKTTYPGETGRYTLSPRRGSISNTGGLQWATFVDAATAQIGSSGQSQNASVFGARLGFGLGPYLSLFGEGAIGANMTDYGEFGGRIYLRSRHVAWRPFFHYAGGHQSTSVDDPSSYIGVHIYSGTGKTVGGGAEWFFAPTGQVELGLFKSSGVLEGNDFSSTRIRIGFGMHRASCGWAC
jgi:hypothetical protein